MSNSSFFKTVIFHDDNVLLNDNGIFWESDVSLFEAYLTKKTVFENICLLELSTLEFDFDFLKTGRLILVKDALRLVQEADLHFLVKSFALIKWDRHYQFCGKCGEKTHLIEHLSERRCERCNTYYYPRISPAIIVLISRGDEILMARSHHFPSGVYALLAGFVEPGETLEAAVHREVFEEVGIHIKNLSYCGSQPWPFPDSLMIGFTAEYDSGELLVDFKELEDAGWYKYNQLPGLPSFRTSIGFKMIDEFIRKIDDNG